MGRTRDLWLSRQLFSNTFVSCCLNSEIMQITPEVVMMSVICLNSFSLWSWSLLRTSTSSGNFPPFSGSKCFAVIIQSALYSGCICDAACSPFFAVVITYNESRVNSIKVAGNSYPSSQNYDAVSKFCATLSIYTYVHGVVLLKLRTLFTLPRQNDDGRGAAE